MTAVETPKAVSHGPQVWPLSVKAYHTLGDLGYIPEKTELLYGQIFQKMSKSPLHSGLVRRLIRLLQQTALPDCFVSQEQPITCADSEPEPDLAVIHGREEDFWQEHPRTAELVIEVCITSHDFDRSKLRAYAGAGIKEVWLVLGPEKQIEIHRQPVGGQYVEHAIHGPGGRLASATLPEFAVELEALFKT
jgi:Uma2 family endonuclease